MKTILVTGSKGQVGSELVTALLQRFSEAKVIATGRQEIFNTAHPRLIYEVLDVTDRNRLRNYYQTISSRYNLSLGWCAFCQRRAEPTALLEC